MPMLEGQIDVVIGVDTPPRPPRRGAAGSQWRGAGTLEVPSDQAGYARLLR
jgi:hypothetical protein